MLHIQPLQTTSSIDCTSTNTVRIEKLSEDEEEDVDITDDLSDDGESVDKPHNVLKSEFCEPEQLTGLEVQTDNPTKEQKVEVQNETKDQHRDILPPPPQSPQPSSSLPITADCGALKLYEKTNQTESSPPKKLQAGDSEAHSKQMTDESDSRCSQSESSPEAVQLEEACTGGTGMTLLIVSV